MAETFTSKAERTRRSADQGTARQDRPAHGGAGFFSRRLRSHSLSYGRRKALVQPNHPHLSIVKQCELLSVTHSTYYRPSGETELNLELMHLTDEQYLETHFYSPGR
jgi:putative transposase